MAARILHFGTDECNRLIVLRNAGYMVDDCPSVVTLDSALTDGEDPAAVVMAETVEIASRRDAISLLHSRSQAPIILFQSCTYTHDESDFDLVISPLTSPKEWLAKVAVLIEHSRMLADRSAAIRANSAQLHREVAAARKEAILERQRTVRALADARKHIDSQPPKSHPGKG